MPLNSHYFQYTKTPLYHLLLINPWIQKLIRNLEKYNSIITKLLSIFLLIFRLLFFLAKSTIHPSDNLIKIFFQVFALNDIWAEIIGMLMKTFWRWWNYVNWNISWLTFLGIKKIIKWWLEMWDDFAGSFSKIPQSSSKENSQNIHHSK